MELDVARALSMSSAGQPHGPHGMEIGSRQRDPNPKDNSLIRKETPTYKGLYSTFAVSFSY